MYKYGNGIVREHDVVEGLSISFTPFLSTCATDVTG